MLKKNLINSYFRIKKERKILKYKNFNNKQKENRFLSQDKIKFF